MAKKGISLHIGVDVVDANHYVGLSDLRFCEEDARTMYELADGQGFDAQLLLGPKATRKKVAGAIKKAAKELREGDAFLISFAGHGGWLPDVNRDERKQRGGKFDREDETWCLHDAQQIDDERAVLWAEFKPGVEVYIISDTCYSGTTARSDEEEVKPPTFRTRSAGGDVAESTYSVHQEFYDGLQADPPEKIEASILLLSACQDHEEAGEDDKVGHGNLTHVLSRSWKKAATFTELHTTIVEDKAMPEWQTPNLYTDTPALLDTKPFEI